MMIEEKKLIDVEDILAQPVVVVALRFLLKGNFILHGCASLITLLYYYAQYMKSRGVV